MLVNHGCALDKMNRQGEATIERLSFVSVRSVATAQEHRQQLLRTNANDLKPFEVLYLGDLEGLGESYVALSDPYYVPATYFGVEARNFPELDEGERRLGVSCSDNRIGRLSDRSLALFNVKWNAYWTRTVPEE